MNTNVINKTKEEKILTEQKEKRNSLRKTTEALLRFTHIRFILKRMENGKKSTIHCRKKIRKKQAIKIKPLTLK